MLEPGAKKKLINTRKKRQPWIDQCKKNTKNWAAMLEQYAKKTNKKPGSHVRTVCKKKIKTEKKMAGLNWAISMNKKQKKTWQPC